MVALKKMLIFFLKVVDFLSLLGMNFFGGAFGLKCVVVSYDLESCGYLGH